MPAILQGILDAIQNSRAAAATAGGSVATFVDSCLTDAKEYLRMANEFRLADQQKNLIKFVNNDDVNGAAKPFKTYLKTETHTILKPDGDPVDSDYDLSPYEKIDWQATFGNAGNFVTNAQEVLLQGLLASYGVADGTSDEKLRKVHQDVIDMMNFSISLIHSPSTACAHP